MDKTPDFDSELQQMFGLLDFFEYKHIQEAQLKEYLVKMHKSDLYYYQNASSKFFNMLSVAFGIVTGNTSLVDSIPAIKERIFETRELCEILNVSKQTVVFWVKKGWLKAEQNIEGGKYHVKESALTAFMEKEGKKYLKIWNLKMT